MPSACPIHESLVPVPACEIILKQTPPTGRAALVWKVWPARRRPEAAAAAVVMILAVSWYGYYSLGHAVFSVIALVVLTASLTGFLFPTTYTLDDQGATVNGFLHGAKRSWDEMACFVRASDFIALSTTPEPTERSLRRGLVIRLGDNEDEVAHYVSRHLPEWRAPSGDGTGDE